MAKVQFFILAVTGLVQQHIDWPLYSAIIRVLGGIENVRLVHHVAAAVLMFETIYHIGILGYKFFVLRTRPIILPGKGDVVNAIQVLRYGLGLSKERPREGRYSFAEKMEYWAVVWGTVVMGITALCYRTRSPPSVSSPAHSFRRPRQRTARRRCWPCWPSSSGICITCTPGI